MIKILYFTLICGCLLANPPSGRQFHRAMILSGWTLNTALHLGRLEGAKRMGKAPDVTIGVCGGSVAAAIANAIPNYHDQVALIKSQKYYQFLKDSTSASLLSPAASLIKSIAWDLVIGRTPSNLRTSLFANPVYTALGSDLEGIFKSDPQWKENSGIPTIIVASRINPLDSPKLFSETYFVFSAAQIEELSSHLYTRYPEAHVAPDIELVNNASLLQATLASISDPFLITPAQVGDDFYLAGAVNQDPLELALSIADTVIRQSEAGFFGERPVAMLMQWLYGFDFNERATYVRLMGESMPSRVHVLKSPDFDLRIMKPSPLIESKYYYLGLTLGVPDTYEEYTELVDHQLAFGIAQTKATFQ